MAAQRTTSQRTARRPGQRAALTRDAVVAAADQLARDEGFDRVTIRRLCAVLAVTPASVYWHVESKDDLVREVLDRALARVPRPAAPTWFGRLVAFYGAVRRVFLEYPGIGGAMLAQPFGTEASLSHLSYVLELLRAGGFDDRTAVSLYNSLSTFTAGHLLFASGPADPDGASGATRTSGLEAVTRRVRAVVADRTELRSFHAVLGDYDDDRIHEEYLGAIGQLVRGAAVVNHVRIPKGG